MLGLRLDQSWLETPLLTHILANTTSTPRHTTKHDAKKIPRLTKDSGLSTHNSASPTVYHLTNHHFLHPLHSLEGESAIKDVDVSNTQALVDYLFLAYQQAPGEVILGGRLRNASQDFPCYNSFILDGVKFKVSHFYIMMI